MTDGGRLNVQAEPTTPDRQMEVGVSQVQDNPHVHSFRAAFAQTFEHFVVHKNLVVVSGIDNSSSNLLQKGTASSKIGPSFPGLGPFYLPGMAE